MLHHYMLEVERDSSLDVLDKKIVQELSKGAGSYEDLAPEM